MRGLWGEEFNDAGLLFIGDWGRGALLGAGALALLLLILTWVDLQGLAPWRRRTLLALRASSLGLALAMLLEPALELRQVVRFPNRVPVLVDVTHSGTLPAARDLPRAVHARNALQQAWSAWQDQREQHLVEFHAVAEATLPIAPDVLLEGPLPTGGQETDLLAALQSVADRHTPNELGGVILVSDGTDTRALGRRVRPGESLDDETLALIRRIGVPVHTVSTAPPGLLRDVGIVRVVHDEFTFVRNAAQVWVEVRAVGHRTPPTITLTLQREGTVLQTRTVVVPADGSIERVLFEFVPELTGKDLYTVDLVPPPQDGVAQNNRDHFLVQVIRDRIRVLQVVGRPTWDVRFLRQLLKGNPNVDLISFFILRTVDDVVRASNDEMSLIPFPTDELFDRQLPSFDLVIFHNFTFEPYNMRQYLPRVRDYVLGGGGFVMIGGDESFSLGGYASTQLAEILPVELPPGRDRTSLSDVRPFRPLLSEAGARHPITRLAFDRQENTRLWESLPMLAGTNLVGAPVAGATVLAQHPVLRAGGQPMPVMVVAERQAGRSMAITADSLWRWSFDHVGQGGSSRPYTAFWNAAIRWLIRDPELNLVQVHIPELSVAPGERVQPSVRVFTPDYAPAVEAPGVLRAWRRDLDRLAEDATGTLMQEIPFVTDARGRFQVELPVDEAGAWRIEAELTLEDGIRLRDDELVLVMPRTAELREIEPRNDLLQQIAQASGGRYLTLPAQSLTGLPLLPARVEQVGRRRVVPLWSAWWVLGLLGGLLAAEWTLRRRWGRM